ncbi:MAG TPA: hypothetical protein VHX44_14540, partial [Planctomycetota bacterium]|nr:hypothetical protein [Planctomycetota bacterium]
MRFFTSFLALLTIASAGTVGMTSCDVQRYADKANFYIEAEENQMGVDAYKKVLTKEKRSTD